MCHLLLLDLVILEGVFSVDYRPLVATDDGQAQEADLSFDIEELGTYRYTICMGGGRTCVLIVGAGCTHCSISRWSDKCIDSDVNPTAEPETIRPIQVPPFDHIWPTDRRYHTVLGLYCWLAHGKSGDSSTYRQYGHLR